MDGQTEIETERQTNTEMDRQTEIETDTVERQRDGERDSGK